MIRWTIRRELARSPSAYLPIRTTSARSPRAASLAFEMFLIEVLVEPDRNNVGADLLYGAEHVGLVAEDRMVHGFERGDHRPALLFRDDRVGLVLHVCIPGHNYKELVAEFP